MLAVGQEEREGGSCACRWARGEKGGVVFAVRQEEREAGSCIVR